MVRATQPSGNSKEDTFREVKQNKKQECVRKTIFKRRNYVNTWKKLLTKLNF